MVGGHFGDDVGGVVVADGAVVDLHGGNVKKRKWDFSVFDGFQAAYLGGQPR